MSEAACTVAHIVSTPARNHAPLHHLGDVMTAAPVPAHVPGADVPAVKVRFDGGALTGLGEGIGACLITVLSLGICYSRAVVMTYRWKSKQTRHNDCRLSCTGTARGSCRRSI